MTQRPLMVCAGCGSQPGVSRMLVFFGLTLVAGVLQVGLSVAGVPMAGAYLVLEVVFLGALLVLTSLMLVEAARWAMHS